ncbi:proto-oncogene Mas-like [Ambystoma mexicanum]|uniref:proto-oncogene Mas-like n=1 Tax=Ambystoma mexicanum TaxID=8296 RepID=UPI0037E8B4FE
MAISCHFILPFPGNTTMPNSTEDDNFLGSLSEQWEVFYWTNAIISLLGCMENGVVIWLLGFRIKRNPFSIYILNLAVADFSFLLCSFCLSIFNLAEDEFYTPSTYQVMELTQILSAFGYNTGLYLLTAISVERCLAVLVPIWYKCCRSKHQSPIVCGLIWVLSFLVTPMETITDTLCPAVYLASNIVHCSVFIPLMVLSSSFLVVKLRKTTLRCPSSQLYLVIISSVVLFLFCAMPCRILYVFMTIYYTDLLYMLYPIAILLSSLNSSINPLIYLFVGSRKETRFRDSIKVVLTRALVDDVGSDHQAVSTSDSHNTAC